MNRGRPNSPGAVSHLGHDAGVMRLRYVGCLAEHRVHNCAMTTNSLRNVKDRLSEFVERVNREHDRVVITRNGRPTAVLISPEDLDSLEETLELMGDQDAIQGLVAARAAVAAGDVVRGVDAVRALRSSSKG